MVCYRQLVRALFTATTLCATTAMHADAATTEFVIPKSAVMAVVNAFAGGMRVNLDNWGELRNRGKNSVTWHTENSYILFPSGERTPIKLDRSETYMTSPAAARRYNVYIDDMSTQNINVQIDGGEINLRMFFESAGNEVRIGCILRSFDTPCAAHILRHTGDINNTHAYIWFRPIVSGSELSLVPSRIEFGYDVRLDSWVLDTIKNAAFYFTDAREKVERQLRDEIAMNLTDNDDLDKDLNRLVVVRMSEFFRERLGASGNDVADWIDRNVEITRIHEHGTNYVITARYPDVIGPNSVKIVDFKPKSVSLTARCPINFGFDGTIETDAGVGGTVWMEYESGSASGERAWRMNGAGTASSTLVRQIRGEPGDRTRGWARMVVQWEDSLGRNHTRKSDRADFQATCSSSAGTIQSN